MSTERIQKFEPELLKCDAATKKAFFHNYTTAHPVLVEMQQSLLNAIDDADSDTIITLSGPTGAGKTTLRHAIRNALVKRAAPLLEHDPSRFAVISEELRAPNPPAFFSWADNFHHLLNSVGEPLVDRKIDPDHLRANSLRKSALPNGPALRRAYEKVLEHRRPIAVLLDEAHAITIAPAGRLLDQFNVIKSISSQTKIPHVLFGTYALLPVRDLDGQVSRRSVDFHFRRYSGSEDDRKAFANVVRNLALALPFEEAPDLDPYLDLFHEKSAGCVGILKQWLEKAYSEALRSNEKTITSDHIERHMLSKKKLIKLFSEIAEGEGSLVPSEDQYGIQLGRVFPKPNEAASASDQTDGSESSPRSRGQRPGERNPERDNIGIPKHKEVQARIGAA